MKRRNRTVNHTDDVDGVTAYPVDLVYQFWVNVTKLICQMRQIYESISSNLKMDSYHCSIYS